MTAAQVGDLVDIAIKGVRVTDVRPDGSVVIACYDDRVHGVFPMPPQAAIKCVTPANWPPQPGDVWSDGCPFTRSWFAQRRESVPAGVVMIPQEGDSEATPDDVLHLYAVDLTLAFRPEVPF